jgi:hypothetical protein
MTSVVPDIVPADEPSAGGEREMLQGFLQYARESLLNGALDWQRNSW